MNPEQIRNNLCREFCADVRVRDIPAGLAISTAFRDSSGDPIRFFLVNSVAGIFLTDDGGFLADLNARGVELETGSRAAFVNSVLKSGGAYWERDTLRIRTAPEESDVSTARLLDFVAALVRVRDVQFWTREVVRSTFKDDVATQIEERFASEASVERDRAVDAKLGEFPADVLVQPRADRWATAVYLVNSDDGLNEALALWQEGRLLGRDFRVMAIIEDEEMRTLTRRRYQRTINRIDDHAIYRGDEDAALQRLARTAGLTLAVH